VYVDDSAGSYYLLKTNTGWRSDWTHLNENGHGGFTLYSNAKQIRLAFVFAGYTQTVMNTEMNSTRMTEWLARLNATYAAAGLEFEVASTQTTNDSVIVQYNCGDDRQPVNDWIAANLPTNVLPVIVMQGGVGSCSSSEAEYVAMGQPTASTHSLCAKGQTPTCTSGNAGQAPRLLAHETGHYFGLAHGFAASLKSDALVLAYLNQVGSPADRATMHNLDFDRTFTADTMPALDFGYWDTKPGLDRCDDATSVEFVPDEENTVRIYASPHDVTAYMPCDGLEILTDDQVRVVRESLFANRAHLMQ
jgi:hypothetical protein